MMPWEALACLQNAWVAPADGGGAAAVGFVAAGTVGGADVADLSDGGGLVVDEGPFGGETPRRGCCWTDVVDFLRTASGAAGPAGGLRGSGEE